MIDRFDQVKTPDIEHAGWSQPLGWIFRSSPNEQRFLRRINPKGLGRPGNLPNLIQAEVLLHTP